MLQTPGATPHKESRIRDLEAGVNERGTQIQPGVKELYPPQLALSHRARKHAQYNREIPVPICRPSERTTPAA